MRLALFLVLMALLTSFSASAQENGAGGLYQVADIGVDVTADTAPHARDMAVLQAQKNGLAILVGRLGGEEKLALALNDDAVAGMVQAFEVQQEKASATHYIGTFTVQFKPATVKALLTKHGVTANESRSKPLIVVPLVMMDGQPRWAEAGKWRAAWDEAAKGASMVPLAVLSADADTVSLLPAADALAGKGEALQNIMRINQAAGALVVVLFGDGADPAKPADITAVRYDAAGRGFPPLRLSSDVKGLTLATKQVRDSVEKEWRQTRLSRGQTNHLSVTVPTQSLAAWNDMKRRLDAVTAIEKMTVLSLSRGGAKIEIEFYGDLTTLAEPLSQVNLAMEQINGAWVLVEVAPQPRG